MIRPSLFAAHPSIVAGFSTRQFMNAGETADSARRRLGERVAIRSIASARQVHGRRVEVVNGPGHVEDCDGLVTNREDLLLTVMSADCALVLLADPQASVIGACHSGWRGTVAGIAEETADQMVRLGARPERILAYVSPCISREAFEVGEEVAAQFPESAVFRDMALAQPHVDLKTEVVRQLCGRGVSSDNIEVDAACTASDLQRFYSYRAEGGTKGRMLGFIGRVDGREPASGELSC